MTASSPKNKNKQSAGHQEVCGETIAMLEFLKEGWYPYSHFLDVDKVDLILRRRFGNKIVYRDVQVKFGKLYTCTRKWEKQLFRNSSWRFFSHNELCDFEARRDLYLAYVLSLDGEFRGDMFILRAARFAKIIRKTNKSKKNKYKVYISETLHGTKNLSKWYVQLQPDRTNEKDRKVHEREFFADFTCYRRNFKCLNPR